MKTPPQECFRAAMAKAGLEFQGPIQADGLIHRFKAAGDTNKNSWYLLHAGPPAAGGFGCWKRGVNETWCERREKKFSQVEWNKIRDRWQEADRQRKESERRRHEAASRLARNIVNQATECKDHPYLTSKGVAAVEKLYVQSGGQLIVPLFGQDGALRTVQFIGEDGKKRFLQGGFTKGVIFPIDGDEILVLCEGLATGLSIHEATGYSILCAMFCGNLLPVAQAARAKWPDRDIIIAADDDSKIETERGTNPGMEAATQATNAIGARLVVPRFSNPSEGLTDFNDLHQKEGIEAVKSQIEAADVVLETDEQMFGRLSNLSPAEYDRVRKVEAERAGIRVQTLDDEVLVRRTATSSNGNGLQGKDLNLPDPEPWPETVNGANLLSEVSSTLRRYVVLPNEAADAIALWIGHAHSYVRFLHSPRLNICSPEKGCGKTTLRDVIATLVPRPLATENLSVAVLFRVVDAHRPTLLADECDSWMRDNEELRGMLNAGHKHGGQALRCEGEEHAVRAFNVFGPAVLCGIGQLPGTLIDRSIVIRLKRAKPREVRHQFDSRKINRQSDLARMLARWAEDHGELLQECDPTIPESAHNRVADNWRPLFAIAQIVGGEWPQRAVSAFNHLTSEDGDSEGLSIQLLRDVKTVFHQLRRDRVSSSEIINMLTAMTDKPWPEAHRGKPISEVWLARRLKAFEIHSRKLRLPGESPRQGYFLEDFEEAFERYLQEEGLTKRNNGTTPENTEQNCVSQMEQDEPVFQFESAESVNTGGHCSAVPDENPGRAGGKEDLRL